MTKGFLGTGVILASNSNSFKFYKQINKVLLLCVQGLPLEQVSFFHNGRKVESDAVVIADSGVDVVLSLPGGKGGFGSMLRSIGAQIEKTTNREACRDLSGRRLRDVNEETRMRQYVQQQVRALRQLTYINL